MYKDKKVTVIITAAGKGSRMGSALPKQFLSLGGLAVLQRAVAPFDMLDETDEILVVGQPEYLDLTESLCSSFKKVSRIVPGGSERQDSVENALKYTDDGIVLIHDGARPYVTREIILQVMYEAWKTGAASAAVPVKDTVRQKNTCTDGSITLDRKLLFSVQTPQGFHTEIIKDAFAKARADGFRGTDDAVLAERAGYPVKLTEGSYANIKITTREDMPVENRVGTGFDVHRLTEGRDLILCGVHIPYEKGLLGHSDADVAVHALMDAMLGAAAMGDIGRHFPDNDPEYEGASSMELLRQVCFMIREKGYGIGNIDVTIMAQRPKLMPYIEDMRKNVSSVSGLAQDAVSIKATTTEKLGFVGREEGIAAEAVCILTRC